MRRPAASRRGDALRLSDMLQAATLLDDLRRAGRARFVSDPHAQAAAVRYLEIVGEAAGALSAEFRARHPELPVRQMQGFASFAKHESWRVEEPRLWEAVQAMPAIRHALESARWEK